MPSERLVIIGGVAAGMSAASRARKRNPQLEIVVLEKGRYVSYGTCGLPYCLSGQVATAEDLIVYTPEFFREKRNIDVRLEHEVVSIEPGIRTVHALHQGARPLALKYDKLILTTGGAPPVEVPGCDLPNVFTCNDLAGTIRFREFLHAQRAQSAQALRAAIVGSGYIGLEVAEALATLGLRVTILERSERIFDGAEPEIENRIAAALAQHEVELIKGAPVSAISGDGNGGPLTVQHGIGGGVVADLAVLAMGIRPRVALAESAGIQLGASGAVAVDERMQTSVSSIYAAGDCAEVRHLVTGRATYFPLGTTANKQGRVAGENAAGGKARFEGVVGTLVTKVFELELARTGLTSTEARENGFRPANVTITSTSRAKYFHGKPIVVTLVWDQPTGRLLGCQMAGEEGVAKRIDVAAMALHARLRIQGMAHLDLSYAPPFAPVWEPILIAVNEALKRTGK